MQMIEKVAREICKNAGHVTDRHWEHYTKAARAAIVAMREPDDAMRNAFIEADWNDWPAESAYVVAIDNAIQRDT